MLCNLCGSPVIVEGNVTKYYVSENKQLKVLLDAAKRLAVDGLYVGSFESDDLVAFVTRCKRFLKDLEEVV